MYFLKFLDFSIVCVLFMNLGGDWTVESQQGSNEQQKAICIR